MNEIEQTAELMAIVDEFTSIEGMAHVLKVYLKLHEHKIGSHWLWSALERIAVGQKESIVLGDYGYVYYDGDSK